MFDDPPVHTTGTIQEPRGDNLYLATLPNGKVVTAHLSKELLTNQKTFSPGDRVSLQMTPYDFDIARITGYADI
jgi:translation initiation factor IF-1